MPSTTQRLTPGQIARFILGAPFYLVYGLVTLVRGVRRAARRVRGAGLALAPTLRCSNGHPNDTAGRWTCASCHAVYHGWVGRCELCGAGAGWMTCEHCGVGIALPWRS